MQESSGIENTEVRVHKLRTRRVVLTFILLSLGVALAMCIDSTLRVGQVGVLYSGSFSHHTHLNLLNAGDLVAHAYE